MKIYYSRQPDPDSPSRFTLPVLPQLGLLAIILLLIFGSATASLFSTNESPPPEPISSQAAQSVAVVAPTEPLEPAFGEVTITGKAAYVWDIAGQRALFKKNEAEVLPLASLTKLMTALVSHELLAETEQIAISESAIKQDGSSGLSAGEMFDRQTLTDLTLMSSSNDGAYALADAAGATLSIEDPANAFVQAMNIRAKEIGLSETYFKNPTGLDLTLEEGGAYGTARDMAFLMEHITQNEPSLLAYTKDEERGVRNRAGFEHEFENTNFYVNDIPGLIGSKTGFTDLAGGNLVVAFEGGLNRPFVVVVLGSTRQERFSDVMTLVDEVQKYLKQS